MTTPPGPLREAHAHLFQLGRSMTMLDLSTCRSAGEMLERVAQHAAARPHDAVVLAHAARPEAWDTPVWPDAEAFERAAGARPALAWCFDYHALLASPAMCALAGITADTRDPEGGVIGRDAHDTLSGVMYERAALDVWAAVPEPAETERRPLLRDACAHLASLGYVEAHDLRAQTWLGDVLADLHAAGELPLDRVVVWPLVDELAAVLDRRDGFERRTDRAVTLGGGKIFTDGTLNSRTAWMLHPYADANPARPNGMAMMTPVEIEAAIARCDAAGVPLAAHAIGDAAVRAVLDAIERVRPTTTDWRIEHAELIDTVDVPRFAELGVVASVQPCHLLADIEALQRAVPDRLDRVLPLRELIDAGCEPGRMETHPGVSGLVFGSDAPIVRADPGDSIQAAVERGRGLEATTVSPRQSITAREAWSCFADE